MHFDHLILTSASIILFLFTSFTIRNDNDFTANVRTESNPTGETRVPRGRPTTGENPGLTSEAEPAAEAYGGGMSYGGGGGGYGGGYGIDGRGCFPGSVSSEKYASETQSDFLELNMWRGEPSGGTRDGVYQVLSRI